MLVCDAQSTDHEDDRHITNTRVKWPYILNRMSYCYDCGAMFKLILPFYGHYNLYFLFSHSVHLAISQEVSLAVVI